MWVSQGNSPCHLLCCNVAWLSRYQAEVSQLEGCLESTQQPHFPPYAIVDAASLCSHLPLVKELAQSARCIIIIPLAGESVCLSVCLSVLCVFTCQVKELTQSARCNIIIPLADETVCLSVLCVFTCQVKELTQSAHCIISIPLAGETDCLSVCQSFVISPVG